MKYKTIESQTRPILYQHPTAAEQRPSRRQYIWVNLKEFALFIAMAGALWLVIHFCYALVAG